MIEETGIVTKTEGIKAKVTLQKKGTCDGCAVKGVCETTERGIEVEAFNPIHAREGQTVKVSMKPQTYLKGTMLVYGVPLVVFITGAIVGKNIGEGYFESINSDLIAAILGFAGLAISLLGIKIWSKKIETKAEYRPIIEEILQ